MLKLRYLIRPLVAVALVATGRVTRCFYGRGAGTIRVFAFTNTEDSDSDWEVRVSVESLGGCGETRRFRHVTHPAGWRTGEVRGPGSCNLRVLLPRTAIARNDNEQEGKVCDAVLGWGTGDPESELRTSEHRQGFRNVASASGTKPLWTVRRGDCSRSSRSTPRKSLKHCRTRLATPGWKRAERAVEVTDFKVKPCAPRNQQSLVAAATRPSRSICAAARMERWRYPCRASPTARDVQVPRNDHRAPGPFGIADTDGLVIDTPRDGWRSPVDLSEHVQNCPTPALSIVQDVVNNSGQPGVASYTIDRSCAGVASLPPSIVAGRRFGHLHHRGRQGRGESDRGPIHGALGQIRQLRTGCHLSGVATEHHVIRLSLGCSVSVTISEVPSSCTVWPGRHRR